MAQPENNYTSDFVINKNKNLTSNYNLGPLNLYSAASIGYNITVSGNWSGTYTGSELNGSGSYNISGSASGSSELILSSSGDYSGSFSGSTSYGTGSYCISGSGVMDLISGSDQFTGSYVIGTGSSTTISGSSGYNLTGTYTSYYFCGVGTWYVSGSSVHTLSGSGAGTGSLAVASYYISGASSYNIIGASEYYISGTHEEAYFSGTGSMQLTGIGSYDIVGYESSRDPGQVPFALNTPGPSTLRGRTTAYKVEV